MDFCGSSNPSTSQMALSMSGVVDFGHSPRPEALASPATQPAASPNKSPPPRDQVQQMVRQNQVGNVSLNGVNIVSLVIDGVERLCLAQISNTLLKDFSYNEIHNRRVALGITCVQCTPVQLEILRRAGAMPISSRRCGMITKREAERLVKSFLEDTAPVKLPENFAFSVKHTCGWGCKGSFVPSRYNSSRAKCIKCTCCNIFFSPNKFIFHFHRTAESKYRHPDAANFNSWRRHITLDYEDEPQDLVHAWEDVKAMFNGGSRKRLTGSISPGQGKTSSRGDMEVQKRPRMEFPGETSTLSKFPRLPYPYPVIPPPVPGTSVQNTCPTSFIPRVPHPAFPFSGQSPAVEQPHFQQDPTKMVPNIADFWKTKGMNPYYNPLGLLWAKNFGLYGDAAIQYGNAMDLSRQGSQKLSQADEPSKYMHSDILKLNGCLSTPVESAKPQLYEQDRNRRSDVAKYMSAFRPVSKEGFFVAGDYKQRKLTHCGEDMEHDALSPVAHSDHSDASGYDVLDAQAGVTEHDDVDINVTDVEQNERLASPHDINKNDVTKAENATETLLEEANAAPEKIDEPIPKVRKQLSIVPFTSQLPPPENPQQDSIEKENQKRHQYRFTFREKKDAKGFSKQNTCCRWQNFLFYLPAKF